MDVSTIAALATEMSQIQTANAVQLAVVKMAMNLEGQGALQLLDAAAQSASSNPPNLGNVIDVLV